MAFISGPDALRQLMLLRSYGAQVSKYSEKLTSLPNGLPYYFVEVTCPDRGTFVIEAYGEEAIELEQETARNAAAASNCIKIELNIFSRSKKRSI